eukprot:2059268-Prymnesium_polylepis.1
MPRGRLVVARGRDGRVCRHHTFFTLSSGYGLLTVITYSRTVSESVGASAVRFQREQNVGGPIWVVSSAELPSRPHAS